MSIKINFIEMSIENWISHKPENIKTFWIVYDDDNFITGYFDNFDKLSDVEADNFLTNRSCYYLYNKPCSFDCNCNDICQIHSINNEKTLYHIFKSREGLIKRNKLLNNRLSNSNFMNGINMG